MRWAFFIHIALLTPNVLNGQDLNTHQWKNRVLLVISETESNPVYIKQLEEWQSDKEGFKERKLIIYQIFPSYYIKGFTDEKIESRSLYNAHRSSEDTFQVILIGLDRGVKYKTSDFLNNTSLFAIIDGMPMRRAELNKNN